MNNHFTSLSWHLFSTLYTQFESIKVFYVFKWTDHRYLPFVKPNEVFSTHKLRYLPTNIQRINSLFNFLYIPLFRKRITKLASHYNRKLGLKTSFRLYHLIILECKAWESVLKFSPLHHQRVEWCVFTFADFIVRKKEKRTNISDATNLVIEWLSIKMSVVLNKSWQWLSYSTLTGQKWFKVR